MCSARVAEAKFYCPRWALVSSNRLSINANSNLRPMQCAEIYHILHALQYQIKDDEVIALLLCQLNCLERYSLFKFCVDTISKQTLTYFTVWVDSLNTFPQTIHKPLTLNGIMHDLFGLFGNYFINLCFGISPKHYIRHHWTKKENKNK